MEPRSQPGYSAVGLPNTAVTITLPQATIRGRYYIAMVQWSYSDVPTNGRLTIFGGGFNKDHRITGGGVGFLPVEEKSDGSANIVITLAAGGGVVVGTLNLLGVKVVR